jgi:hypothetical protein
MNHNQCPECGDVFSADDATEVSDEVLVKGARTDDEFVMARRAAEAFKTWPHRNLCNDSGMSAAMKITFSRGGFFRARSCRDVFCFSSNGRLVVTIPQAPNEKGQP